MANSQPRRPGGLHVSRVAIAAIGFTDAVGAVAVITFDFNWNSFLGPLVVLRSRDLFTVPIGLNLLQLYFSSVETIPLQLAAATLSSVPVIAVFAFLRRHFVQGLALTGIKG